MYMCIDQSILRIRLALVHAITIKYIFNNIEKKNKRFLCKANIIEITAFNNTKSLSAKIADGAFSIIFFLGLCIGFEVHTLYV